MAENRNITPEEYTDKDMQVVARLAYINFSDGMVRENKEDALSLYEIFNNEEFYDIIFIDYVGNEDPPPEGTMDRIKYDEKVEFLESLKLDTSPYSKWKIVDYKNGNKENGFCAITIETDANNAIVGFRGSEGLGEWTTKEFRDDWIFADLGLLNSIITLQQASATQYMKTVQNLGYSNYVTCGHSLGGNLAIHALLTAPDDMNIVSGYGLDSPGYSDEYLSKYSEQIKNRGSKINHYQWSLVGGLLNNIGNENNE